MKNSKKNVKRLFYTKRLKDVHVHNDVSNEQKEQKRKLNKKVHEHLIC